MKVIIGVLLLNATLLQACMEKIPTVQIQNYDGPIYLSSPNKHTCDHNHLLHTQKNICDADCTCVTKVPKYCDNNMYGNYPNYYETKMCNVPYDVPKMCNIPYYEVPKVCTASNCYSDSKFDISNYYDQYCQQQKCFLNKDGCQKLGFVSEAKAKIGVVPDGFSCADNPRTLYGYKCIDRDELYNYGSHGCGKSCLCKKCGGYRTL